MDILEKYFSEQAELYRKELEESKDPDDQMSLLSWDLLNLDHSKRLLQLYIDKCKFRHAFAYF